MLVLSAIKFSGQADSSDDLSDIIWIYNFFCEFVVTAVDSLKDDFWQMSSLESAHLSLADG